MLTLPIEFASMMLTFAPLFSKRSWQHVQVLVVGAILAPGRRTVTAILRVMGLSQEEHAPVLPPRLEPGCVVSSRRQPCIITDSGGHLCAYWATGNGSGRHYRATAGREN